MKKKNVGWWIVFIILFIWQLPQAIVGLLMMPFLKNKQLVADRHYNFCWRSETMTGGISLGPFAFASMRQKEQGIAHETDGHTVDSKIFGWLYLFIIGIPSVVWAMTYDSNKHCYHSFYTEKRANKHAKLGVSNECKLYFL